MCPTGQRCAVTHCLCSRAPKGLNTIWNHTAAGAMVPPTPTTAPLPVTMMDIAQVVVRHAAVIRQHQHGVNVLQLLGLHPYAF
eukprot:m.708863 g.708863  ORF g.708863 m.708863 type:complete len:83 (+) comp22941_c0_seq4:132-380(+)